MRTKRLARGLSVIEVVFSLAILSVVMVGIFGVFHLGSQSFQHATLRQSLQSEARISWITLRDDLRHSTYTSVTDLARPVSVVVPGQENQGAQTLDRDGISFATVKNWNAPNALDPLLGFPNFDSYVVYYATTHPEGRLVRQLVEPSTVGQFPYSGFSVLTGMNDNPVANSNAVNGYTRILSSHLLSFKARRDPALRMVRLSLRFRGHGGRTPAGAKQADETLELRLDLSPENTYPKL